MDTYTALLYVLATGLLLIGSSMDFKGETPDYFFISGTALFFLKALIYLGKSLRKKNEYLELYSTPIGF